MARISTYVNDTTVSGQDKLLGSDSTEATRNFPVSLVADYLDNSGSITISDQLNVKFITAAEDVSNATFFKDTFGGNNSHIGSLSTILISKNNADGGSLIEYTRKIFNSKINLVELGNKNNFATFSVTYIVSDPVYTNFFKVSLVQISGNGVLSQNKYYSFSVLPNSGTETYTHVQGVAESIWNVTHDLNKKPSVTVVDSADNIVFGEVEYLTTNSVRLKFSGGFSGKAYFN